MKAVLVLCVFLGAVFSVRAQKVEAVEAAPENSLDDAQLPVAENEEQAALPQEEEPQIVFAEEEAASPEGRFFVCPSGWIRYKNSCYLYLTAGRSWASAAANCARLGASLPSVHNVFEYSFLQELTRKSGNTVAWMGGFYFQGWRWMDQSAFDYSNWSSQNTVSRYQCMHVNVRAGWSNNNCANSWPSICVKRSDTC